MWQLRKKNTIKNQSYKTSFIHTINLDFNLNESIMKFCLCFIYIYVCFSKKWLKIVILSLLGYQQNRYAILGNLKCLFFKKLVALNFEAFGQASEKEVFNFYIVAETIFWCKRAARREKLIRLCQKFYNVWPWFYNPHLYSYTF